VCGGAAGRAGRFYVCAPQCGGPAPAGAARAPGGIVPGASSARCRGAGFFARYLLVGHHRILRAGGPPLRRAHGGAARGRAAGG
nr:hypothetical protein [Tanacetum cinerariifolium]